MKTAHNRMLIYVIAIIAATGGLLFGFDTGVISGAIPFFQKDFGIDNGMVELITSAGLLGAILGALFCGKLTDRLGRRKVILASAVIFCGWGSLVRDCCRCLEFSISPSFSGSSHRRFFFCRSFIYS